MLKRPNHVHKTTALWSQPRAILTYPPSLLSEHRKTHRIAILITTAHKKGELRGSMLTVFVCTRHDSAATGHQVRHAAPH